MAVSQSVVIVACADSELLPELQVEANRQYNLPNRSISLAGWRAETRPVSGRQ